MKALRYLGVLLTSVLLVAAAPKAAVPNGLDQAFVALDRLLSAEERSTFMHKPERQAIADAHFAVGMYIRNERFRHGGSTLPGKLQAVGAQSLDDMSSIILTSYWRHLNGKPIRLEKQGSCYKRWWKEALRLENEAKSHGRKSWAMPDLECP